MGNDVSSQGNLPSHDTRDVRNGSADTEQYDWQEQAEAPETNTLLADSAKSYITPLSFEAPAKRNPHEYPHIPYISRN